MVRGAVLGSLSAAALHFQPQMLDHPRTVQVLRGLLDGAKAGTC